MSLENLAKSSLRMVSVSGAGHSGTTLLASMIGAHPDANLITYETGWFLDTGKYELALKKLNDLKIKSTSVIIEKTPRHVYYISRIAEVLPNTKFLVTIRNPFDLIASLMTRYQNYDKALDRVISDLEAIEVIKGRYDVLIVRYEDLITKTEEVMASVCTHVGLTFNSKIFEYYKSPPNWFGVLPAPEKGIGEESHLRRRAWQVQQPLFDGRGRYKRELDADQIKSAEKVLDQYIIKWGY